MNYCRNCGKAIPGGLYHCKHCHERGGDWFNLKHITKIAGVRL